MQKKIKPLIKRFQGQVNKKRDCSKRKDIRQSNTISSLNKLLVYLGTGCFADIKYLMG